GVAVDAFGSDLIATAAFDRVIQATHDNTARDEHAHEESYEQPTGGERRPDGAIQDPMIRLKVGGCTASHNPQNRRHRPRTWSKDGAGEEDFHMLPHGSRKDRCKDANGAAKSDRQGEHGHPFGCRAHGGSLPINCDAHCDKWIKSS